MSCRCRAFQRVGFFRRRPPLGLGASLPVAARIAEKADMTMPELSAELAAASGTKADPASLSRWLIRNGYRFKKNSAGERARSPRRQSGTRGMDRHTPAANAA
jgi:transposase